MPKKPETTDAQNAMRDMRKELGFSQQDLAVAMKKSVVAVARWESSRSPNGPALMELAKFARKHRLYDIWIRFQKELIRDQNIMAVMPTPEAYLHVVALNGLFQNRLPGLYKPYLDILKALRRGYQVLDEAQKKGEEVIGLEAGLIAAIKRQLDDLIQLSEMSWGEILKKQREDYEYVKKSQR